MHPVRYRSVMVAFDGSPGADLALDHACAIAQACLARVTLVAVRAPSPLLAWRAPPGADLQERLRAAVDGVPDHLRATSTLLDGDPARELVHAAREHDVLFIGAGPVADDVVRLAELPVVVVHRPAGPDLAA
jgi:nucleotide-binding universal stress UspA family protein